MKKLLISMLVFVSCIAYGNDFNKIKTFKMQIKETRQLNNTAKEKKYTLKAILPNLIVKEIILPHINEGEKYIYRNNKKIVYIPMFDQRIEEEISEEENYIIKLISDLKEVDFEKVDNNQFIYGGKLFVINEKEKCIEEIVYSDSEKVIFSEYKKLNDKIKFPHKIEVYDGKNVISELIIEKVEINLELADDEFEI